MTLLNLSLSRFRLIAEAHLELEPGINLLTGANAQGKTSVLEAIGYLSTGRSFRTARDREAITWDSPEAARFAAIEATYTTGPTIHMTRFVIEPRAKSVWVDGKSLRTLTELWGLMRTVFFVPADLRLVQGPPALRREALDALLGQTNPAYLRLLSAANRALMGRNHLLRSGAPLSDPQFDAYEAALAPSAARVLIERAGLTDRLSERVIGPIRELTRGAEDLRLVYEPGFPVGSGFDAEGLVSAGERDLAARLKAHWREARPLDRERATTRDGFHRDDVRFEIAGADARSYASQGQVRCCVLALRLAELDTLAENSGHTPLLLLDDILGELDRDRSAQFLRLVAERQVQTLITATDSAIVEKSLPVARRFEVASGRVVVA